MPSKRRKDAAKRRRKLIKASKFEPCELTFSSSNSVELRAAEEGQNALKQFEITAYNGGSLSLSNFDVPCYIDCSDVMVHGAGKQQPILKEHNSRALVGHGTPVVASDNLKVVEGVISHENEYSQEILRAAANGFEWQASVGGKMTKMPVKLQAGQTRNINGRSVSGPAMIIRGFLWRETSFCGIGCDDERASARVAASEGAIEMDFNEWLEASGFVAEDLNEKQLAALQAAYDAEQAADVEDKEDEKVTASAADKGDKTDDKKKDEVKASADDSGGGITSPRIDPEVAAAEDTRRYLERVREARRAEDRRVAELEKLAADYSEAVPKMIHAELFDKAIAGELDKNKFELELIKAARQPRQTIARGAGYRRREFDPTVVEAALLRTGGMNEDAVAASVRREAGSDKVEEIMNRSMERNMQGFGLQDLVFASIESAGEEIPSRRMNSDVIELAMRCSQVRASSGSSTVSLPGTLSNIANKQMLQSYDDAAGIWSKICSTTDTSDFKAFDSYRMTEAGVLEEVGPSGEIKHTTLGEDKFTNRVMNHARLIGLTEEMLMNDDLGAFQRLARHFGRMSAHAIEQMVIKTLTGAKTTASGSDATDFFRGDAFGNMQPNYFEGADSALDISSLGVAWQKFADQTDSQGKPIMLEPAILLTTTANAILAGQLYKSTEVRISGSSDRTRLVTNEWQGMFEPVYSPYLSQAAFNGGSAQTTQWYLIARVTDDFAPIQVAFLNGQRTPQVERFDYDPNMLGVTFRCKLPFGVSLQDPRCIVKAKGAA